MKPLEFMVKELVAISGDVSKGILEFVVPPKPVTTKPKWYYCDKCKKWYALTE